MAIVSRAAVLPRLNETRHGQYAGSGGADDVKAQQTTVGDANADGPALQEISHAVPGRLEKIVLLRFGW